MDPSIMKLLEEDEDETMHSGADVEALQAALNRDIGGVASTSSEILSHESNQNSQPFPNWSTAMKAETVGDPSQQQHQEQNSMVQELKQQGSTPEKQKDVSNEPCNPLLQQKQSHGLQQAQTEQLSVPTPHTSGLQLSEKNPVLSSERDKVQNSDSESQHLRLQKIGNEQTMSLEQAAGFKNHGKQIPFVLLLPTLRPHLDKDREMQLQTLFAKLRKNEITKDQFVRLMRGVVGDQVLKSAVTQLQSQQAAKLQAQALARQQQLRMPVSSGATQFTDSHTFGGFQKGSSSPADPSHNPPSAAQVQTDPRIAPAENNAQKLQEVERQPDSHRMQISQIPLPSTSIVNQEKERTSISVQAHNKQQQQQQQPQQQHVHVSQTSIPMYGSSGSNYHLYSGTNVNASGSSMKSQLPDSQMRQMSHQKSVGGGQLGGPTQGMNMMSVQKFDGQSSVNDPNRLQSGSISHYANKLTSQQSAGPWQATINKEKISAPISSVYVKPEPGEPVTPQQQKSQLSNPQGLSAAPVEQGNAISGIRKDDFLDKQSSKVGFSTTSMVPQNSVSPSIATQPEPNVQVGSRIPSVASPAGIAAKTPPKKPAVGQKKPLETLGSSPPVSSKKQKVSGAFADQSIEQLNDVTAVSGVNLREEEEQLFSAPKEDSRISEASRRVVQEEEERLILQKIPLQKKLAEIMTKCGLKNISNDVERCLSLCVEERMRGLLSNLIRVSKQRVDVEKPRHRTVITSDVRQQIMTMNRRAKEEWEKKQAEAEKLRKVNEPEGDGEAEGEKEKDDGRLKSMKANKEEDDKMRTTAANVAARAAVGGDDMLSKWQLMAEQARQKREGAMEVASGSQPAKGVNRRPLSASGRNTKDSQESEKRGHAVPSAASGTSRKFGRSQAVVPQFRVDRTISVKDIIAVLEREPQMSKSTLIYRLYERSRSNAASE